MNVVAQNFPQSSLQQVSSGVIPHSCTANLFCDSSCYNVTNVQIAVFHGCDVQVMAIFILAGAADGCGAGCSRNRTAVANLSAAFCIERGLVQNDDNGVALNGNIYSVLFFINRNDFCIGFSEVFIAGEYRLFSGNADAVASPGRASFCEVVSL